MSVGTAGYYHALLDIMVSEQYLTNSDQDLLAEYLAASYSGNFPIPYGAEYDDMQYRIRRRSVAMEDTVRVAFDGLHELADTGEISVARAMAVHAMFEHIVSDSAVNKHVVAPILSAIVEGHVWAEDNVTAERFIQGLYSNDWIGIFSSGDDRESDGWGNQWGLFWGN